MITMITIIIYFIIIIIMITIIIIIIIIHYDLCRGCCRSTRRWTPAGTPACWTPPGPPRWQAEARVSCMGFTIISRTYVSNVHNK